MIERDAERVASALEAANRRQEAAYAKADADKSAQAASDAAYWAKWLFITGGIETVVTAFGVGLVALTLGAARRSANEAKRGADEMKRSADAALAQLEAVRVAERAYLSFPSWIDPVAHPAFQIFVVNTGRTQAHIIHVRWDASVGLPSNSGLKNTFLQREDIDLIVPGGGEPKATSVAWVAPVPPQMMHLFGYVRYVDIYQRFRRTYFRYDRDVSNGWKMSGGAQWNRAR